MAQREATASIQDDAAPMALVCFSHLRWGFVWQRPQHLMTRFARRLSVYVVEEPEFALGDGADDIRVSHDRGVTILTPLLPATMAADWGFNDRTNPRIRALLTPYFAELGLLEAARGAHLGGRRIVAWYYTPMALGAEPAGLTPALTVFDAMDELASFAGAPPALRQRESALMAAADLVFTGGPSLHEARKGRHPRVSCYPSGVEQAHFAPAAERPAPPAPPELAGLPRPLLGFYGVLDERLDLELLAGIADARPAWTVAMIGPVIKIAEADLPRRPNLVYLGPRAYADLPAMLAAFDVAILPFARNNATRFISPTKTLEYLAGGKPIVSTPIKDVADLYGEVVRFAAAPVAFVEAAEQALGETPAERGQRHALAARLLVEHDWDAIADGMWNQITAAMAGADRPVLDPQSENPLDGAALIGVSPSGPAAGPATLVPSADD